MLRPILISAAARKGLGKTSLEAAANFVAESQPVSVGPWGPSGARKAWGEERIGSATCWARSSSVQCRRDEQIGRVAGGGTRYGGPGTQPAGPFSTAGSA